VNRYRIEGAATRTSRVIWKGAISFGLVDVPVQLYPTTRPERTSFNLIDKETADPIGYKQINKRTGKEVKREFRARQGARRQEGARGQDPRKQRSRESAGAYA
jgi:non-homologous end joining protein Ku